MVSLLPQEVLNELDRRFGVRFRTLGETERLALATASVEGKVTTERLKAITGVHGTDLTAMFRKLVDADFLEPEGVERGTCYHLPGTPVSGDDVAEGTRAENATAPEHLEPDSEHFPNIITDASEHSEPNSEHLQTPEDIARPVREASKVSKTLMIDTIMHLCRDNFMPLKQMAQLLGRSSDTIRVHYLYEMIRSGQLELKYPSQISHPSQAYKAKRRD